MFMINVISKTMLPKIAEMVTNQILEIVVEEPRILLLPAIPVVGAIKTIASISSNIIK